MTSLLTASPERTTIGRRFVAFMLVLAVALGVAVLVLAAMNLMPDLFSVETWSGIGSTIVGTAYAAALAARTGGRSVVFAILAAAVGIGVLVVDSDLLRTGASVLMFVIAVVLGVMATVPAISWWRAVVEVVLAMSIAAVGAVAAVGFAPLLSLDRFRYATFILSLLGVLMLALQLGGRRGFGRRGLVVVVAGAAMLAFILGYAEVLRSYGDVWLVSTLSELAQWCRETLGGFPEPLQSLFGIPLLLWGIHMRARRRQGWWLCAFGATGLVPLGYLLAAPGWQPIEIAVTEGYTLIVGAILGAVLIRVDAAWLRSRGRRAQRGDLGPMQRFEPPRSRALI